MPASNKKDEYNMKIKFKEMLDDINSKVKQLKIKKKQKEDLILKEKEERSPLQ